VIALCWSTWDDAALLVTRVTILAVCLYGFVFYSMLAADRHRNLGIVPRRVYAFIAFLMGYLVISVAHWTLTCTQGLAWQQRTTYGTALIWIIALQVAVARRSEVHVRAAIAKADSYRQAVAAHAAPPPEDHPE
jgi:hypothetical protein